MRNFLIHDARWDESVAHVSGRARPRPGPPVVLDLPLQSKRALGAPPQLSLGDPELNPFLTFDARGTSDRNATAGHQCDRLQADSKSPVPDVPDVPAQKCRRWKQFIHSHQRLWLICNMHFNQVGGFEEFAKAPIHER